jgi:starvation-inducible DNA-binding protein
LLSYAEFTQLSQIKESVSASLDSTQMLQMLLVDNENVALSLKKFSAQASELNDPSTVSLIDERAAVHEKTAWMLRSLTAK